MPSDSTIGYSFDPSSNQKRLLAGANSGGQLGPMANAALRILSLRLPSVLGGSPISPEALLRSKVGTGLPAPPVAGPGPSPLPTASGVGGGPLNTVGFGKQSYMPFQPPTQDFGTTSSPNPGGPGDPTFIPGQGAQTRRRPTTRLRQTQEGILLRSSVVLWPDFSAMAAAVVVRSIVKANARRTQTVATAEAEDR
jgi:hypothetical protein